MKKKEPQKPVASESYSLTYQESADQRWCQNDFRRRLRELIERSEKKAQKGEFEK